MLIEFNVTYPVVHGLPDAGVEAKVNEELKNCAMQTVNQIYDNPSDTIKERVISEKNPMLIIFQYQVEMLLERLLLLITDLFQKHGT